jgi:5-formyltetrahydrofolate cyclo-ligase
VRTEPAGRLRQRLREHRRARDPLTRRDAARALAANLLALPELRAGGRIATYLPADGELDPNVALDELRSRGWQAYLPIVGAGRSMRFAEWVPGATLTPNRYGIPEPPLDTGSGAEGAEHLDVVLVPSVAIDRRGNRLGMGAGYYDRALAAASSAHIRPVLVGVVLDDAVMDELDPDPWDVPVDLAVSERRVLRTRPRDS